MVFIEPEVLTTSWWREALGELQRRLDGVEALGCSVLGSTQVVCSETDDCSAAGATHSLMIISGEVGVAERTAFLEYGGISEAMDEVFALRSSLDWLVKRQKLRIAGHVRVAQRAIGRVAISFHGSVEMDGWSQQQLESLLRSRLHIGTQIRIARVEAE